MTVVRTPEAQLKDAPLKQTESTRAQYEAQVECEPFFIDITKLPPSQIDHLRDTGLLASAVAGAGTDDMDSDITSSGDNSLDICLLQDNHITYLSQIWMQELRSHFVTLDSSRPWMLYWCLHGCD
jgi:hypothetical protein